MAHDYDALELTPAPNAYFDQFSVSFAGGPDSAGPQSPSTATVRAIAYLQRSDTYEQDLATGYRRIRWGGMPHRPEHPQISAAVEGATLSVRFDATLDRQLTQIYVRHGWDGVLAVQASMKAATRNPTTGRLHPWPVVRAFFDFSRNLLALAIQDAMTDIATAAGEHVVTRLSRNDQAVADAWGRLAFEETKVNPDPQDALLNVLSDAPDTDQSFWRAGNRGLAAALWTCVQRVVAAERDLRAQREELARLRQQIDTWDAARGIDETRRRMEASLPDVARLYQDVADLVPLATVVVPLLAERHQQAMMEHLLGTALAEVRGLGERIARDVNDAGDYLRARFGTWDQAQPLESYLTAEPGVEAGVVALALGDAVKQPRYLPMASEATLFAILTGGRIPRDSFGYVVLNRYLLELGRGLERERALEQRDSRNLQEINRLAAGLSLISLSGAPNPWVVKGLALAAGLTALAYQAYVVAQNLSQADRQIAEALAGLDPRMAEQAARLEELRALPGHYVESIAEQLAWEIGLVVLSGGFEPLKRMLHLRAYYLDLEMLVQE